MDVMETTSARRGRAAAGVRSRWAAGGWRHGVWAVALLVAACGDQGPADETTSAADETTSAAASTSAASSTSSPRTRGALARGGRPASGKAAGTITLITGDRVTLQSVGGGGKPVARVQPGPGRQRIAFSIREHDGEVTVVPHDVLALLSSGQLDPALFEVSKLIADGYGDDQRSDVPLVITGQAGQAAFGRQTANTGIVVDRVLPTLHAVAVRQDKASAGAVLARLTAPSATLTAPGATLTAPGATLTAQGATLTAQGATLTAPGATLTAPGATLTAQGATLTAQGATLTAQGATLTAPGATLTAQGATLTAQGATLTAPGATLTAQGATLTAPGATLTAPGARLIAPGARLIAPGATLTAQGATPTGPDARLAAQGATLNAQGATATAQGATLNAPSATATAQGATLNAPSATATAQGATLNAPSAGATSAGVAGATLAAPAAPRMLGKAPTLAPGAMRIWLDRRLAPVLDHSVPQIGGPAAHARGFTGAGVTVAVLDTGIDDTHPDLAGKVTAAKVFVDDGLGASDTVGHGTHVASIIAGTGAASKGQFQGVAPDATLISGRVCELLSCPISAILAGMEWAVVEQHARIVNVSIGGTDTPDEDPVEAAVNQLSAQYGTLFVVAAGNDGPRAINSPGSAEAALTVGAVDRDDQLAGFSSQGPRTGDSGLKPDLTAPGVDIVAAKATDAVIGEPVDDAYLRLSGTSMATPHASGAVAILLQQHPDWDGARLKAALIAAANPNPTLGAFEQGAGRLDIDRGTAQTAFAEPASLSLGLATFPHGDDPLLTRTVRYHNPGSQPLALTLAAALTGPAGAAPAGAISITPAQLTVPPGGTADAVVTVSTSFDGPDGLYSGAVTATGGDVRIVTPLGVDRAIEAYDLTLRVLDRAGAPGSGQVFLTSVEPDGGFPQIIASGTVDGAATVHLPRGQYFIQMISLTLPDEVEIIAPRIALVHDTELVLDARLAQPFDVTVPGRDLGVFQVGFFYSDHLTHFSLGLLSSVQLLTAQLGPSPEPGDATSEVTGQLIPAAEVGTFAPTEIYYVAHQLVDRFFTGWRETIRARDFANVHASHAGGETETLVKFVSAVAPIGAASGASGAFYTGPFSRTEHFHGAGFQWSTMVEVGGFVLPTAFNQLRTYREGRSVDESRNRAPLGPAFTGPVINLRSDHLGTPLRDGDTLFVAPSMYSDQETPAHLGLRAFSSQGRARLLRDGEVISEIEGIIDLFPPVDVPPGPAVYRFEQALTSFPEEFELSTHVEAAWTFRSQHADHPTTLALPTLRFLPELDDHNQSAARLLVLPVHVERAVGAPTPRIATVHVEASFDDGATWSHVPLLVFGADAIGFVVHPRSATHVSLRGGATDVAGNAVEQTIIRAYGLAPR